MFWLQENLILMKDMFKKYSTDQSFILKEITSLKIYALDGQIYTKISRFPIFGTNGSNL